VLGIVGGFLLARRRQREAVAAAIASARAEGHAAALAAVQASQSVNVAVDASGRAVERSDTAFAAYSDGYRAALSRVAGSAGIPPALDGATDDDGVRSDRREHAGDFGGGADHSHARDRWAVAHDVAAVPISRVVRGRVP